MIQPLIKKFTGFSISTLLCMLIISCNEKPSNAKLSSLAIAIPDLVAPADCVQVQKQTIISTPIQNDTSKKYIYLTFDDGPQHGTSACIETVKKEQIKASFFMIGNQANDIYLKKLVASMRNDYPQILLANHSYTHANNKYIYFYHHPNMAFNDFIIAQESLNVPFKIIRLPGNSAWIGAHTMKASPLVKPVCKMLDSAGYNVIGWDVEWSFNHKTANPVQTPETMLELVNHAFAKNYTHTKNHLVILSHDRMFRNANFTDSLQKFIGLLKQNSNYVFETVDHYPNLKKPL
ncbi:polysaccharide deacetylase family protein [Hydrotalea flava]|uniref:polysaccharide deacetylase family protein n=1 Tax=Hydrotalea flava TaxID=714549 RepID=UPI0008377739|nr:polysaccharide deacetylase family protein [Hydrotalea flava]